MQVRNNHAQQANLAARDLRATSSLQEDDGLPMYINMLVFLEDNPHTGNTRPSRMCVIQEYRYYTMSLSLYNESLSIS